MVYNYEDDFSLTSQKKGGGARKQQREKGKNEKNGDKSCYSSKHIRAKEAILLKNQKNNKSEMG